MLEDWIYKGQINDPYNEFMIYENKEIVKENLKDNFNEKYPFFLNDKLHLFEFKISLTL